MLAPRCLTACQRTGWPLLPRPLHPLPTATLPFHTPAALKAKSKEILRCTFFETREGGSGGAVSGWHLILVCIQIVSSEQGPDSAEILWLTFMHMNFESSHT